MEVLDFVQAITSCSIDSNALNRTKARVMLSLRGTVIPSIANKVSVYTTYQASLAREFHYQASRV